ncbi:MAG: hypothetical protein A2Y77_14505 [Planctomycetes bacterium RBG_13_62_9]|nr:MAG: hypothetical protein A2Y77_14505 [Planctomycetes bacterium RBG_13_62_9]
MAKVLIFGNFLEEGSTSNLQPLDSAHHYYTSVGPGRWQANPYGKSKHASPVDLLKRIITSFNLVARWRDYDVLIVDGSMTGLLVAITSLFRKGRRKLVVASFNVPRRRGRCWNLLCRIFYKRVDHVFVHSTYDIDLVSRLYGMPGHRISFRSYVRKPPAEGTPEEIYLFEDKRPYILSFGSNARDYGTLFDAVRGTDLPLIVVAREYNLKGLRVPANVKVFCNIPLEQCDRLVRHCLFTVFTFDGSEPSCGQISIVTSLMLGKPVVCTDWIGVHDYISDASNGLLAKMRDASGLRAKMRELAEDAELRRKLGENAHLWTIEHTDPAALHGTIDQLVTSLTSR